jgi:hypothetical protein
MRLAFPGRKETHTTPERRDMLIKILQKKYPEGSFEIDKKTPGNIVVKMPGEKEFKIEHEQTRAIHLGANGAPDKVSYEILSKNIPAGSTPEGKMAYSHIPLDLSMIAGKFNKGGRVPGGIAQKLFPGGQVFLGMPRGIKQVEAQRAAKIAMEKASEAAKKSRYSKEEPVQYGDLLEPTSGRSFPVPGIGGLYSRNGEKVFVKPMLDEKAALAEMRATEIARDVNGLHAPKQKIVVMKDPTDPTGKRNLLALESKFDKTFAEQDGKFTTDQYFKQLVASALRGDKDLGRGNLSGNVLADVGPAGVFSTASGLRDYSATMPKFKHQAMVNLMGVKGSGAKKFFAEATADIPKGMTADQYHERMLKEIETVLPKLKQTIGRFDLNSEEKVVYEAMIKRLSDARQENYRDLHGIHSAIKIAPEKVITPAAIAKMNAADALKRRQKGHAVSLSDNAFKTPANGFAIGGLIGNVLKGKAMHRIGAGFGPTGAPKPSTYESAPWGVNSLSIDMADKLFANSGLRKHTQKLLYDKFAAALAKEKPYGYVKMPDGTLKRGLEPESLDSVIRLAASDMFGDRATLKQMSPIDKDILRNKYANWDSKKDTPLTEALKQLIFKLEGRATGGAVNARQPYVVGEKGPEIFVPRNAGGIVPNGYNAGGIVKMMIMQLLGMQGGQALGEMSGLPGGAMIGATLGSMIGYGPLGGMGGAARSPINQRGSLKAPIGATKSLGLEGITRNGKEVRELTKYGQRIEALSLSGNKFSKVASVLLQSFTKLNLVVGAGAAALYLAKNRWDAHRESMRLNALGYGMTAEGAQKAGLKFTSFNDKIKEAIGNAKALKERNVLLYESMQKSNTPLDITIEEYKKLKKEVKDNYSDQVLLINKTDSDDQVALAQRLKTQLISMGLSAEDATKKVYGMYAASKFAFAAAKYTVSNKGFNSIKDSASAAASAVESLNKAMESKRDPKEQFNQLNTTMMALSTDVQSRQDKAVKEKRKEYKKEGKYFSAQDEAELKIQQEKIAMDELNNSVGKQVILTKEVVDEMAKIDPSIRKITDGQDTSISLWQKTRLLVNGYSGDLRNLNAEQTNAIYNLNIAMRKVLQDTASKPDGILSKQYSDLNTLKIQQAKYEKAAKGQKVEEQISDRKKIAALQKQIDLNNKLADSKIKALDAAKAENDIANEIAKKQAEYDAAIATGNSAAAQQASLDIKSLQGTMQYNAQKKSIEDAATLANAPLLKQIELIQAKQQGVADAAAIAGQALTDYSKKIDTAETAINGVITAMSNYRTAMAKIPPALLEQWKKGDIGGGLIAAVVDAAKNAKVSVPGMTKDKNGNYGIDDGTVFVNKWEEALKGLVKTTFEIGGDVTIDINGKKLNLGPNTGSGTKSDPYDLGKAGTGTETLSGTNISNWSGILGAGPLGAREKLKDLAKEKGVGAGEFFTVTDKDGKKSTYKVDGKGNLTRVVSPYAMGGYIPKYSDGSGGKVRGAGTSTSDSIPAMLSNGEYVVKASAVEKYGVPFFDAANAQRFAFGGMVNMPRYETGGQVLTAGINSNANNATIGGATYNITNNINGYDGDLEQLSSMVTQRTITAIKTLDSRNSKMSGNPMTVGIK